MRHLRYGIIVLVVAALALGFSGCRGKPDPEADDVAAVEDVAVVPAGPATERRVLVLCYHAMSDGATATYDVPTGDFAEQLALLDEEGYESVLPAQIADYLEGKGDLPEKAVCITFDDGPESILTESKPLMDEHGYTGAAFLIADSVGGSGKLTWDQVRELEAAGWEIGSHTACHEKPTKLDADACMAEFEGSRETIAAEIEGDCAALAYPFGLYDAGVVARAREAGYRIAFTIDRGPADWTTDIMMVPRQMLVNGNSLKTFGRWLEQEKLHLEDVTPAIGERMETSAPEFTATVADEGVSPGELEISRDGNPVTYDIDEATRTVTFTPELSEGANNLRVNYYGSPRREVSWVVVYEAS